MARDLKSWVAERAVLMPEIRWPTVELYADYQQYVGCSTPLEMAKRGLPGRKRFYKLLQTQYGCGFMVSGGRRYAVGIAPKAGDSK